MGDEPRRSCLAVARFASLSAFNWLYLGYELDCVSAALVKRILLRYVFDSQFDPGWSPPDHSDAFLCNRIRPQITIVLLLMGFHSLLLNALNNRDRYLVHQVIDLCFELLQHIRRDEQVAFVKVLENKAMHQGDQFYLSPG